MIQRSIFKPICELQVHPVADLLPSMSEVEFQGLVEDIRENGLIESIWIDSANRIIDGRHRYRACLELEMEPITRLLSWEEDPLTFVISKNLHRRHLSVSQRSMLALRVKEIMADEAQRQYQELSEQVPRYDEQVSRVNLPLKVPRQAGDQSEAAGAVVGVSKKSVQYAAEVEENAIEEIQDFVRDGDLSVSAAAACSRLPVSEQADLALEGPKALRSAASGIRKAKTTAHMLDVTFSSKSDEHYTPDEIIQAALECFGGVIHCDPCSNSRSNPNIPALIHYTIDDDGLSQPWEGKVFLNPPYSGRGKNGLIQWAVKVLSEFEAGRCEEALILVYARVETKWWKVMRDLPVCFPKQRIKFKGNESGAPSPSAVLYLGEDFDSFYSAFSSIGDIYQRVRR